MRIRPLDSENCMLSQKLLVDVDRFAGSKRPSVVSISKNCPHSIRIASFHPLAMRPYPRHCLAAKIMHISAWCCPMQISEQCVDGKQYPEQLRHCPSPSLPFTPLLGPPPFGFCQCFPSQPPNDWRQQACNK
jgi:hypothetical protein